MLENLSVTLMTLKYFGLVDISWLVCLAPLVASVVLALILALTGTNE